MKIIILLMLLMTSGCAVGPLIGHEPARTVGKSNHEIDAGFGQTGALFKWNYGVAENLDIGLQMEALSVGGRVKYAFLNNREKGFSLAVAAGAGSSIGGEHFYGDLMASYITGSWEPYTTFRVVRVKTDPWEFGKKDTGEADFVIESYRFTYGQYVLGMRYWINPNWMFSVEGTTLFTMSSDLSLRTSALFGAALGYRF